MDCTSCETYEVELRAEECKVDALVLRVEELEVKLHAAEVERDAAKNLLAYEQGLRDARERHDGR